MRLQELHDLAIEYISDVEDLVALLELSIEDILTRFPDRLYEHAGKFGVGDEESSSLD